jgi:hypothetical protein
VPSIDRLVDKTRQELSARPILPFGALMKLGAVGVIENNQFSPRGTARSILGGRIGGVSKGQHANWQLTSGKDVKLNFLGSGKASTLFPNAPSVGAKVEVSFESSESFLLSVDRLTISTLSDPSDLIKRLLDAYRRGTWRRDYVLVYELITPAQAFVLLSKESDSKFLLGAKAKVKAPQGTADLAGKFGLRFQSKDAVKLDSGGQPLFFNAYRVKESFWSGDLSVGTAALDDPIAEAFERV